jgi:hypothetical protein
MAGAAIHRQRASAQEQRVQEQWGAGTAVSSLLDLDPDLGARLPAELWPAASRRALVRTERFAAGPWRPPFGTRPRPRAAVFIADGLLVRETRVRGRSFSELLGAGDLAYPWHSPDAGPWLEERWRAIEAGSAALLDERMISRIAPLPALLVALAERSARRGRFLSALALTRRMRRTEARLLFLFSLLAERWGRMGADGIQLSLPLTHELLGELVGAQRQTVTTALGALRTRALVMQLPGKGWLLDRSLTRAT